MPSSSEVHVWRIDTSGTPPISAWKSLSPNEFERARRYVFNIHRDRWVHAHAALRSVLASYLGHRGLVSFKLGQCGKPELADAAGPRFNLSHSGDIALIAIAADEVGVDVEQIHDLADLPVLIPRVFSVAEQKALSDLQGRELVDGFYRCWTRKESYVKARGAGLQIDLQSFDVSVEPGRGALVCARSADPEASEWTITKLDIAEGYAGAVTLHGRRDVTCRMFNWDRLDSPSIYGAH